MGYLATSSARKGADVDATCGACSKSTGRPCQLAPVPGKTRCKWHGGKSTGPRTEEGKQVARENGKKGGRPSKQAAQKPNPKTVLVAVPTGRCKDCARLSAAHHCMAAESGDLGPLAPILPALGEIRHCSGFCPINVG